MTTPLLLRLPTTAVPITFNELIVAALFTDIESNCAKPLVLRVALNTLLLETRDATVVCPVLCKLTPTTLVLLLIKLRLHF